MKTYSLYLALVLSLFAAQPVGAQANVIISEFMPANTRTLLDEDGTFSDWIELFNAGNAAVDLAGWHLTDDPTALAKWTFPPVNLAPGGFLLVFASGKNRTYDVTRLHTSFQLNADGGYLALVKPDGTNIASAYVNYPNVKENVSFGVSQKQTTSSLLANSVPRILVPTNAAQLPAAWNQLAYSPDSAWSSGALPPAIGFDTNQAVGLPSNVALSGTAVQSTVNGAFTPNLAIDNNYGNFSHTLGSDSAPFWQVTLTNQFSIFSIILYNRTSCCGSRLRDIIVEVLATNASGTVTNFTSALLNPENAGYSYPNGPAALTNDLVALTGGPVSGQIVRIRRIPDPDLSGSGGQGNTDESAVLSLGEVVINASGASGLRPYFSTDVQNQVWNKNSSVFLRMPFVSTTRPDSLSLRVRYDDGFVAYLNGVEIARRNAPASLSWDASATADRNLAGAIALETIDLSAALPQLVAGTNLLAVQVMNASSGNSDLLFQPELIAVGLTVATNVFLANATPRAANNSDYYFDEVHDTHFSVDRGFFDAPFSLSITSGTPDALIYYSFNGDEPSPTKGILYSGPFNITNTSIVRARAFKTGWKPTDVDTATYIFLNDVIYQVPNWPNDKIPPRYFPATWGANSVDYGMDPEVVTNYTLAQWREALTQIPTMSIVTEMGNLFDATTGIYANAAQHGEDWERPASLELLEPTNAVPGRFQENCGLRIRGGFSRNTSFFKHSLRIFFSGDYGAPKLNYPLFGNEGAQEFDKFDLRTSQNYSWPRGSESPGFETMVREVFCRKTLGDMGQPYRRSRYYHLYLNGQYWGLYETDERPSAGYGESYFGGSKTNYDVVKCGNRGVNPNFATEATDGNLIAWSNLWVMTQIMRTNSANSNYFRILGRDANGQRDPSLPVMVDVDNLIDYMLEIFYSGDGDATLSGFLANNMPNNWFGIRDRTNPDVGFRFFNSDCEHTLGTPSSQNDRTGPFPNSNEGNFIFSNPQWVHEELTRNLEYRIRFADHVQKHFFNGGALTLEACTNRFLTKANQITKAIRAYSARWGDAFRTTPPYGESDWTNAIAFVMNWFPTRATNVLAQLRRYSYGSLYATLGAPAFSQFGGAVPAGFNLEMAHTNGAGAIFFTVDGADPRAIGGTVSSSAQAYSTAFTINQPTLVRARVLSGTNWSALLEYYFYPPQDFSKLLVTEIMYHPPDLLTATNFVDGDEFEFLELKNAGPSPLNLSGLQFTAGLTFAFTNGTVLPPGAFFVLVRNPVQFANRYPGVTINGVYTGKLDNGGEALTLSHPLGSKVLSVTYGHTAPWPLTPDKFGFSLVPMSANANPAPDNAANWRASTFAGGSPGTDDPTNPLAPVLINEVLSHSDFGGDWIELFNPNSTAVNVSGWFLTDDAATPKKYRIPNGTSLQPFSYLVFDETNFNATPGTNGSFSLNGHGDDVYLFSGDANTNLTGYSHGFVFGAAPDGGTFGRYVISTGEEQFPGQLNPTRGLPNSGPSIGPVVITEVHYHPELVGDEFVELKNIATNTVLLYDVTYPTNAWRVNGLDFVFPTNLSLKPSEFIIIAATNPALFRARFNIPTNINIFGPYSGLLQHSGERLEVQRPDAPDTNGVAYITVDEVRYNDKSPWPAAADGSGASLQRKSATAYGNDPANWEAAVPTPGVGYAAGQSPVILAQPSSKIGFIGSNVTFSVIATGAPPLNYQWRYNGSPLAGRTSSNLVLTNVQLTDAGTYHAIVFNNSGSAASAIASLTVVRPPLILQNPAQQLVRPGGTATFSVGATGNGFLRYQWQLNGTNLSNQTNTSLVITNAQFANEGSYAVMVSDSIGSVVTTPANLVILVDPIILQNPLSQDVVAGSSVVLSVTVSNTANLPIGYRWRKGGTTYSFVSLNSYTCFLLVTNVTAGTSVATANTNWTVVVTNIAKVNGNISPAANLNILADSDGDGIPDVWEAQYFGGTNAANPNIDSDGDGMSNWQEYVAGTAPNDAASYLKIEAVRNSNAATLRFGAISNKTYTIQFTERLGSGLWSRLSDIAARETNRTEVIVDGSFQTNRFYRIVTPQQ